MQLQQPVNRFPEFIAYMVQALKKLCPMMGKKKMSETLARAGLHLGTTTVNRMLKQKPRHLAPATDPKTVGKGRVVTAKYSNHLWHVDLTVVPTGRFWTPWFPFSLPQCWPFAWWVGVIVDHFSRRVMGITAFKSQPTSDAVRAFLGRTIAKSQKAPRHIVCDRGKQFDCDGFRRWCQKKGIKRPRYGAIGHHGSIAVVERAILTMKCLLARLLLCCIDVTQSCESSPQPRTGTTSIVLILGHAARRPTIAIMGNSQPTAARGSNLATGGHVVRRVPSRGRWCGAARAQSCQWKSVSKKVGNTCRL